jgi:hypothetical protein
VAGCGSSDRPTGSGPASSAPATGGPVAPSAPPCLPKVVESGFSVADHVVHYGVIARSDCPQAAIDNAVSVRVLDAAGKTIAGQDENTPDLAVLLPGQQVGGAGTFYMWTITTVSRVDVEFTASDPAPVSAFAAWPTSVRVTGISVSKPDDRGRTTVSGQIVTEPADAPLCWPHASLIVRDSAGRIIYGQSVAPQASRVSFTLAMPAKADTSTIAVYVALGLIGLSLDPASTAACRT